VGTREVRVRHAVAAMSAPLVQPQFRPTLSDLLGPRWRTVPLWLRAVVIVIVAAIAVALLYPAVRSTPAHHVVIVRGSHPVNFLYTAPLAPAKAARGELVALSTPAGSSEPQRVAVRPLTLPRYRGDPGAALLLYSVKLERYLEAVHPGLVLRDEGRTRINMLPAYQITFQLKRGGRSVFGRDIMIVADQNATRVGAVLELMSVFSPHVPKADALGSVNPLKLSLRSFRLGSQRP
jgi:hypothetical protein